MVNLAASASRSAHVSAAGISIFFFSGGGALGGGRASSDRRRRRLHGRGTVGLLRPRVRRRHERGQSLALPARMLRVGLGQPGLVPRGAAVGNVAVAVDVVDGVVELEAVLKRRQAEPLVPAAGVGRVVDGEVFCFLFLNSTQRVGRSAPWRR